MRGCFVLGDAPAETLLTTHQGESAHCWRAGPPAGCSGLPLQEDRTSGRGEFGAGWRFEADLGDGSSPAGSHHTAGRQHHGMDAAWGLGCGGVLEGFGGRVGGHRFRTRIQESLASRSSSIAIRLLRFAPPRIVIAHAEKAIWTLGGLLCGDSDSCCSRMILLAMVPTF